MASFRQPLSHTLLDRALGTGLVPDPVLLAAVRRSIHGRLKRERRGGVEAQEQRLEALIQEMSTGPIAERVEAANDQHYEVPPEFFRLILGPRLKYSACLWTGDSDTLERAEERMLELSCDRAGIKDGMEVLDLGCGWGSFTLYAAERFPGCRITAVSNSSGQRRSIEAEAKRLGLDNIEVITADVNEFDPKRRFDRVVSVEMFEHMRNWKELLGRVSAWLKPDGRAFIHVFSHRKYAYRYEESWSSNRFFTAGTMPSHDLMLHFQQHFDVENRWAVSGTHYARTADAWLGQLDSNRAEAHRILSGGRSGRDADEAVAIWRVFLIAVRETWACGNGEEWIVSHYLLKPED
ncbi:MAG: cyclopropane-fatty-acyl-phospholipid synthase family protein [Solirubrobacterales bacterium]